MAVTGPASANTLNSLPPDGNSGSPVGGRSSSLKKNIRCAGDNLNTVTPGTLYNTDLTVPGLADPLGCDLPNELFGVKSFSRKCKDSETAADPHAKPAHIG